MASMKHVRTSSFKGLLLPTCLRVVQTQDPFIGKQDQVPHRPAFRQNVQLDILRGLVRGDLKKTLASEGCFGTICIP